MPVRADPAQDGANEAPVLPEPLCLEDNLSDHSVHKAKKRDWADLLCQHAVLKRFDEILKAEAVPTGKPMPLPGHEPMQQPEAHPEIAPAISLHHGNLLGSPALEKQFLPHDPGQACHVEEPGKVSKEGFSLKSAGFAREPPEKGNGLTSPIHAFPGSTQSQPHQADVGRPHSDSQKRDKTSQTYLTRASLQVTPRGAPSPAADHVIESMTNHSSETSQTTISDPPAGRGWRFSTSVLDRGNSRDNSPLSKTAAVMRQPPALLGPMANLGASNTDEQR